MIKLSRQGHDKFEAHKQKQTRHSYCYRTYPNMDPAPPVMAPAKNFM